MISSRSSRSDIPSPVSSSRTASSDDSRSSCASGEARRAAIRPYATSSSRCMACSTTVGSAGGGLGGIVASTAANAAPIASALARRSTLKSTLPMIPSIRGAISAARSTG